MIKQRKYARQKQFRFDVFSFLFGVVYLNNFREIGVVTSICKHEVWCEEYSKSYGGWSAHFTLCVRYSNEDKYEAVLHNLYCLLNNMFNRKGSLISQLYL